MSYRISCFLPAFNEVENLRRVVDEATAALDELALEYEVVVIDDGSTDGTKELADLLASERSTVRAVHHEKNRGYGAAVVTGIRASKLDYVFYTDGDGQFRVSDLDRLLPELVRSDCAIGYRLNRRDGLLRRFNGAAWSLLMDLLLRLRVRDVDCAFKIFRRSLLEALPLDAEGAMVSAEILARIRRAGARITEVGVPHHPRLAGESTGGNPLVILKAFRELLRLWNRLR